MSGKSDKEAFIEREDEWERFSENQRAAATAADEGFRLQEDSAFLEALAAFERAADLWPGNPIFLYEIAATLNDDLKEQYQKALWAAKRAVELDDEEPVFHQMLGNVLRSLEDKPGAVREYLRAAVPQI